MNRHSFKENTLAWAGLDLTEGVADGTSIVEAFTTDRTSTVKHGNGGETMNEETDEGGTLTITVVNGTKLHSDLMNLAAAAVSTVKDCRRQNLVSGEVFTYRNMRIQTRGTSDLGIQATTTPWTFRWQKRDYEAPATGLTNEVGS